MFPKRFSIFTKKGGKKFQIIFLGTKKILKKNVIAILWFQNLKKRN